ncbi:MAG: cytochrome c oxidase assembly protein, partial [Planctomycetota bacterium]|nr:cytochrome c oxidase assembly protein [Planctomycetota bacterium]
MSWMDVLRDSALESWDVQPGPLLVALLVTVVYLRGFRTARRSSPGRFPRRRAWCFVAGVAVILCSIFSPLDELGGYLLSAHMIQHLLLLGVGPPLILLGAPAMPMLLGLPALVRREWIGPFLGSRVVQRTFHVLVHPVMGWTSLVLATWAWHVSFFYELALVDPFWHEVEHGFFITTAFMFWFPVIQPWPSRPVWPRSAMIPYLLLADLQNTVFSAFFAFAPRVIYPTYEQVTPVFGMDPLEDQALAGAIMWVPGSLIFIAPIAWIIRELIAGRGAAAQRARYGLAPASPPRTISLAQLPASRTPARRGFDLMRVPLLGPLIRSRRGRHLLRFAMLGLALVVVLDGFLGPRTASMNLAGVLPWTHWRGIAVILLLVGGNLLCMACPFTLPRTLAGRWLPRRFTFPRWLRNKWLAVLLLVCWLWMYEVLALWDSPSATAIVVVGYFVAAFLVDAFFRGAAFCKYVCPIGQFHFVQSMVSPLQVGARDAATCASCTTRECIRGSDRVEGCGTGLFIPKKVGNLDCTFCLDCADACPKDNVVIAPGRPVDDLLFSGWRSSLGRLATRWDVVALLTVLVFGAFANAMGMTAPVIEWQDRLTERLQLPDHALVASGLLLVELVLLPALVLWLLWLVVPLVQRGPGLRHPRRVWVGRTVLSLVPLGVAMWIVHYQFHFLTSWASIIPVAHRALLDVGGAG